MGSQPSTDMQKYAEGGEPEKDPGFKVVDKRGVEEPTEPCRVCGAPVAHSREYNQPTMDCIHYLREEIRKRED